MTLSEAEQILIEESGLYDLRGTITFIGHYADVLYSVELAISDDPRSCTNQKSVSRRVLMTWYEGAAKHAPNVWSSGTGESGTKRGPSILEPALHVCMFNLVVRVDNVECASMLTVNYRMRPHHENGVMAHTISESTYLEIQRLID